MQVGSHPRILITRLSAIGDCVHTLPLVSALRARFPQAFIGWVTQPAGAALIAGLDGLDELIVVPRDWMKRPSTLWEVRDKLRAHRFDFTVDPQSLTKSSLLAWLSGARTRIGFTRGQARELSPLLSTHRVYPRCDHVVDRYMELLRPLGVEHGSVAFNVPRQPAADAMVSRNLASHRLGRFALLNPGAGWPSKVWPHERYAIIAQHLQTTHQLPSIVLWAGDEERAWAERIVEQAEGSAVLAPDTSLPELASICRQATLFIGSDTGPLHLAAAVDTPCVAMYGPTKPDVCGPYGVGHSALQVRYQDGSSAERRGNDNSAMREITTELVVNACDDRLIAGSLNSRSA